MNYIFVKESGEEVEAYSKYFPGIYAEKRNTYETSVRCVLCSD
jgi:hypothetical protein